MIAFQIIISVASVVLQSCLFNSLCKKTLKTNNKIYSFISVMYVVCIVLFAIGAVRGHFSVYTITLGVLFGVVTALGNLYKMRALASGPMHITNLVTTSSMIIPAMSGIFFGEYFSIQKLIAVFVLIYFIYLSFGKTADAKANQKWMIYCILAALLQGSIGVLQKIHQSSAYKAEVNGFLLVAFICSFIYSRIMAGKPTEKTKFNVKLVIVAVICGICTYTMNVLNLRLSGLLPSQLFFPLVNGSTIVLNSIMSVVVFKESISRKQFVGLCGGIVTLIAICFIK